ncbi:MAG: riboflavin synthase [Planctomycetes bacterium]|nr:riboflavin synthase [Planctomycetota bacterium]
MFTGLIEAVCKVRSVRRSDRAVLLTIDLGKLADDCKTGDSIAVNGVCLTITRLEGGAADFDVSSETLAKSTLDKLSPSSQVNIERAVKATDRFGGHFVQGHIDGTAIVKAIDKQGQFAEWKFAAEAELLDAMVVKGSVAVDGISLTISGIDQNSFSVYLIPETLNKTKLCKVKIGDKVNIETDIIVKTIKKQLEKILPQSQPLTVDKLKGLGF